MSTPDWRDALPRPPAGGQLRGLWMTSFEPPDAALLVEHLLPALLGCEQASAGEGPGRTLFLAELALRLAPLRGRLNIITSPTRAGAADAAYPWLWRHVSHFIVGAQGQCVQHAKFWAMHWQVGATQYLDLYVSSTNLSGAAFRSQLQAGWSCRLPLASAQGTPPATAAWSELVDFLSALGRAAGSLARERLDELTALLMRAAPPQGVEFIASIPGRAGALQRLAQLACPAELHVLAPTIGDWNARTLPAWLAAVGVAPQRTHLYWIDAQHPWATPGAWQLTPESCQQLLGQGVHMHRLSHAAAWHAHQPRADLRWSHAKLYLLRSRNAAAGWRLLVTSANWSTAAWGAGRRTPDNFELGVLLKTDWRAPLGWQGRFDPPAAVPWCQARADERRGALLAWAQATWDGSQVELQARTTETQQAVRVLIEFTDGSTRATRLQGGSARIACRRTHPAPLHARLSLGDEALCVPVLDVRAPQALADGGIDLPGVDPLQVQALHDALLLQRYAGRTAPLEDVWSDHGKAAGAPQVPTAPASGAPGADYSLLAWRDARAAFAVVDQWQAAARQAFAEGEAWRRAQLLADGQALQCLFARRADPAHLLAAEELGWRLEHHL